MIALATIALVSPALAQKGDASHGQQDFRVCTPCHSLEPDRNMTGPSLAICGPQGRVSAELRALLRCAQIVGIIWDDRSLDGWLTDPQRMVPDNDMPFEGIRMPAPVQTCWPSSRRHQARCYAGANRAGEMKGMGAG